MSKLLTTARMDLRTTRLTPLQRDLHAPNKDNAILSTWGHENVPILRNAATPFTFKMSAMSSDTTKQCSDESKLVEFVLDERYDLLVHSFLKQLVPAVTVRDEYRDTVQIAWTRYLGLYAVPKATVLIKDVFENELTPAIMYMILKYYTTPSDFEQAMEMLGHVPAMYSWSTRLEGRLISVFLPFFYSYVYHQAFELYKVKNLENVVHRFELRPISQLLRMRRTDDGGATWRDIPFNFSYISIDNDGDNKYLPTPTLKGLYALIEDSEKKEEHCKVKEALGGKATKYFDDFTVVVAKQECRPGRTGTVDIETSHLPCKAIAFYCVDCNAAMHNNHGNFTTDAAPGGGWPMLSYSLNYKNMERYVVTDMFDHEMVEMKMTPYRNIRDKGMALLLTSFDVRLGEVCSTNDYDGVNATLFLKMANDPDDRKAYNLYAILMCTKKMTFTQLPPDPESGEIYYAIRVENGQ